MKTQEVFIVSAKRTPTGGFLGSLSPLSATQLGSHAITAALAATPLQGSHIGSVYMGNVLSAGLGQSPVRQAAIHAGIPPTTDATTINKVCASGLKAVMMGAQQIALGVDDIVVAGGMESMSNVPHYLHRRQPLKLGHDTITDGLTQDGLTDSFHHQHMGNLAELCARTYNISRAAQDDFTIASYQKAIDATREGKLELEMAPIDVLSGKKKVTLTTDEDIYKLVPEKVPHLKPVFEENGTITAANASNLNDGAAALVLASANVVAQHGLAPLARIIAYADAALAPEWYSIAPASAIKKALQLANLTMAHIDLFEINEAYAAVALANQQLLGIPTHKLNIYGGAVAMGHPLGASGARILCTLTWALRQEGKRYGIAAICNGGGGASAIIIENLQ
jgi:acetyl-CoA C-acetyltransferase